MTLNSVIFSSFGVFKCIKKTEPPFCKVARLSFKTRGFPSLPHDRFGFSIKFIDALQCNILWYFLIYVKVLPLGFVTHVNVTLKAVGNHQFFQIWIHFICVELHLKIEDNPSCAEVISQPCQSRLSGFILSLPVNIGESCQLTWIMDFQRISVIMGVSCVRLMW